MDQSESDTMATSLARVGFQLVSGAIATRRRIENVKISATASVAIFSQNTGRK